MSDMDKYFDVQGRPIMLAESEGQKAAALMPATNPERFELILAQLTALAEVQRRIEQRVLTLQEESRKQTAALERSSSVIPVNDESSYISRIKVRWLCPICHRKTHSGSSKKKRKK